MEFGQLLHPPKKRCFRYDSKYETLETGNKFFKDKQNLYSIFVPNFHVNIIRIYDRVIVYDDLHAASIEQQRFLEKYFAEADLIDTIELSVNCASLDEYLGSYFGENNGRYSD